MERLTVKRPDGRCAIANNDGASPTEQMLKIPKAIDRLAAYEDTGLEPEDFKKAFNEGALLKMTAQYLGTTPDRLREWTKADKEDRLVALPCKVGDTVWSRDVEPWNVISVEWFSRKVTHLHCVSPVTAEKHTFSIGRRSLGKTVFLTREEAEAALEGASE